MSLIAWNDIFGKDAVVSLMILTLTLSFAANFDRGFAELDQFGESGSLGELLQSEPFGFVVRLRPAAVAFLSHFRYDAGALDLAAETPKGADIVFVRIPDNFCIYHSVVRLTRE